MVEDEEGRMEGRTMKGGRGMKEEEERKEGGGRKEMKEDEKERMGGKTIKE